jgi:hypothetical protein
VQHRAQLVGELERGASDRRREGDAVQRGERGFSALA